MYGLGIGCCRIFLLLCVCVTAQAADHAADHVLIKFKPEAREVLKGAERHQRLSSLLTRLNLPTGASLREAPFPGLPPQRDPDLSRFCFLKLPKGLSVEQCLKRLQHHPLVDYAEPDGIGSGGAITPNDPDYSLQWHHHNTGNPGADISTPRAWEITTGSTNVIVAVLDTGLNMTLSEFAGRLVAGHDFVNNDSDPSDDHGHGTSVAGTLCANANNGTLVAGVDWHCRLMPVKVLNSGNFGNYSDWALGVDYAVSNGCKVINLSAGGSSSSTTLTRAITNAIAHGVLFVTITHNQGSSDIRYPGDLPESITVGATRENDARAGFSNYGPQIDLVAPGTNIWTVNRFGNRTKWWGTSFAAPQVSGVCSLMAALRPNLTQEEARALLTLGAEDVVGDFLDTPGFDNYYGWGRLNAYHSLLLAQTCIDSVTRSNDLVELSWPSPSNAAGKQPFLVQSRASLDDAWNTLTDTNAFSYATNRTFWTNSAVNGPSTLYQLRLRIP